jgi:predicted transcriptional regulator
MSVNQDLKLPEMEVNWIIDNQAPKIMEERERNEKKKKKVKGKMEKWKQDKAKVLFQVSEAHCTITGQAERPFWFAKTH